MEELVALLEIDFVGYIIVTFTILTGIAAINTVLGKVIPDYKGPFAWWKKFNEDRKLISQNAEDIKKLAEKHDKDVTDAANHEQSLEDKLTLFMQEMRDRVGELGEKVEQYAENRVSDRKQSLQIQKEWTESQSAISEKINVLSEKFAESEKKNNLRDQAELKDKIGSSYRFYHEKGEINDMELEALEDLIAAYEEAGGKNSFVHSVVQKEMYTWRQVTRE